MEKEFVPYKLAIKIKALGFDEPCFGRWWFNAGIHKENEEELEIIKSYYFGLPEYYILAPTFSHVFRWFREKYKLHSCIYSDYSWNISGGIWDLNGYIGSRYDWDSDTYSNYEEAELACLEQLIEIVETKSE